MLDGSFRAIKAVVVTFMSVVSPIKEGYGEESCTEVAPASKSSCSKAPIIEEGYANWSVRSGMWFPTGCVRSKISSGIYKTEVTTNGWCLVPISFPSDTLLRLPGTPIDLILDEIKKFWERRNIFEACGFIHKRGILLYGPAGAGKTSIIKILCNDIVDREGIVLSITSASLAEEVLHIIRQIEPERPILTIWEDIETFMGNERSESTRSLLSLLDGETQVNHIVNLATTNKPEMLEDRIARRPGRFDLVIGLNPPVLEAREEYLRSILHGTVSGQQIRLMAEKTEGLGLAHLRELIASSHCLGNDLDKTLDRLRGNIKEVFKVKNNSNSPTLGFTTHFSKD
jgi:ATPase family associated with various cellular activities (AAA)